MFLLLDRCVRVDQERTVVEQFAVELLGGQDHAHGLVECHVAQEDGDFCVGSNFLVEHEVHAGGATDRLEHAAQRGVAKLDAETFLKGCGHGVGHRRLGRTVADALLQGARCRQAGGFGQHLAHLGLGLGVAAGIEGAARVGQQFLVALGALDLAAQALCARIRRVEDVKSHQQGLRGIRLAAGAGGFGLVCQQGNRSRALTQLRGTQGVVGRVFGSGGVEHDQRLFGLAFEGKLLGFTKRR